MEEDMINKPLTAQKRAALAFAGVMVAFAMIIASNILYTSKPKMQVSSPAKQVFTYATADNVRQQVHLPDGSILSMSGNTSVAVHFYPDSRVIKLNRGTIAVDAVQDKERPMIVEGGSGKVVASGNRFNVQRDGSLLDVAVAAGSVRVNAGSWWNPTSKFVNEGMRLQVSRAAELGDVKRIEQPVE
jgi:ferric-dicitrate binding protein FerR (iron transport regulator)